MRRKIIFWICFVILLAAVGTGAGLLIRNHIQAQKDEELRKKAEVKTETTEDLSAEEETAPLQIPVDFNELWKQNSDDDYYMDHTVDGDEGLPGAIMTEYSYNSRPFVDPVTLVYGHNMLNDSFFSHLIDYQDETFRNEHSTIEIYTPDHIYTYKVFATVTYDNRHILDTYDCQTTEGYQAFLDSLYTVRHMPTWIEDPLTVTTDDRIIVLSTCNGIFDQRYLIGAVLVDEQ